MGSYLVDRLMQPGKELICLDVSKPNSLACMEAAAVLPVWTNARLAINSFFDAVF